MATNIQLELALKEAQKEISDLRGEVEALKTASAATISNELRALQGALDKTFRVLGCQEWVGFRHEAKKINVTELVASMNKAAPAPVSVIPTVEDWQNISKELLGRPLMTLPEIQEMIQKDAATTGRQNE